MRFHHQLGISQDIRFVAPQYKVVADYWVRSNMVTIKRTDKTWVGAIDNFHRANARM